MNIPAADTAGIDQVMAETRSEERKETGSAGNNP